MDAQDLQSQRLDHLGIVAGICHEIGLIETSDAPIGETGRKVSVGQAVQAMILNGLGFVSRPLYLSPEFFHNKPVDLLVGKGLEAADLHDDCLGRALDALFEQGVTELFAAVSARALQTFGIETHYAHLDSTSFGLHGAYERPEMSESDVDNEPIPIQITHGYSRDHRPDLKQAMVSLICANQASLPTWFRALDSNSSDSTSFAQTIQAYMQQFTQDDDVPVLVADAALYNQQSGSVERGFRFLKDPLFFADSLFLKKPSRIMALLMVMGLSLLVYALAEHQVRTQLAACDETLPDQTGKPTHPPTARRVFQMMEGIDLLLIEQQYFRQRLVLNMTDVRWQIVNLFSHHVQKFYNLKF